MRPLKAPRALVVVAHPDDEVLGAGIWLHRHPEYDVHVLHLTNGSPSDGVDARTAGFATREEYAAARRLELAAALRMVGVMPGNCHRAGVTDKEAYLHLPELIRFVGVLSVELRPELVLTCAYEGGHPDHDSAALVVSTVRRKRGFDLLEFPLYHADATGAMVTGRFLPGTAGQQEEILRLSDEEQELKRRMLACFASQQPMLNRFGVETERFRRCGNYDFTQAPHSGAHPGALLYERWGWAISGETWRQTAAAALLD